jgi:uncharacterized DUF497 family protein
MGMPVASGFDWDSGNSAKCRRHGVLEADIEALFRREVWVVPDPAHSASEVRFRAVGRASSGRHIFVAFTLRRRHGSVLIRPISARFMHRKEVRHYEEQKAATEKAARARE